MRPARPWQWPDAYDEGPACDCMEESGQRRRNVALFGHLDECPAAGVAAPAPAYEPPRWSS